MKRIQIDPKEGFNLLAGTQHSQAGTLVLEPGQSVGGPDNTHEGDQWLLVLSGTGTATVSGEEAELREGTLVLIAAGEPHQVKNTGGAPLKTLSFYAPPEF